MVTETQSAYFPYVGAPGWLTKLRDLFRRSVPAKLDADWLTAPDRFTFSVANARQLISMLQKIDWVGPDGTVLDAGKSLRASGEPYQATMRGILDRFYADLMKQIESAPEFSAEDVNQYFVAASDMGQSGRDQMIAVFRWFLREAGMAPTDERIWKHRQRATGSSPRDVVKPIRPSSTPKSPSATTSRNTLRPAQQSNVDAIDPRIEAIRSVLRITIDGSWDSERIQFVFQSLDKLLKGDDW